MVRVRLFQHCQIHILQPTNVTVIMGAFKASFYSLQVPESRICFLSTPKSPIHCFEAIWNCQLWKCTGWTSGEEADKEWKNGVCRCIWTCPHFWNCSVWDETVSGKTVSVTLKLYLADFDRNAALLYPLAYRSKITISEFALNCKFFKRKRFFLKI